MMTDMLTTITHRIKQQFYDAFLVATLLPSNLRHKAVALFGLHLELARIAKEVSEPMLGHIRLQWWRDAFHTMHATYTKEACTLPQHEIGQQAGALLAPHVSTKALISAWLDAREHEIEKEVLPTVEACVRHVENLYAAPLLMLAHMEGVVKPEELRALNHLGISWGLTQMLRFHPHRYENGLYENIVQECERQLQAIDTAQQAHPSDAPVVMHLIKWRYVVADYAKRLSRHSAGTAHHVVRPSLKSYWALLRKQSP